MRKVFLVLSMVGASFAGGAVINSPDQTWSRDLLARARQMATGTLPIVRVEDDANGLADAPRNEPVASVPAAPTPPLSLTPEPAPVALLSDPPPVAPSSTVAALPRIVEAPAPAEVSPASGSKTMGEALTRVFLPRTTPRTGEASTATPTAEAARSADPPPPLRDPGIVRASGGVRPTAAGPTDPPPAPPSRAEGGWPAPMLRMKELGVSQYWLEGRPGGPVRIRCVVPVPGRAAAGPMFEAEADDEALAVAAVLRRIDQWKAAERP